MKKILTIAALLALGAGSVMAQETFPRNGVYDERPGLVALTNATIHTDYKTTLQNATLLIRGGKVEAVGTNVSVPAGAVVVDAKGKHIYPGLVDMYSSYGMPEVKIERRSWTSPPQMESEKKGAYSWNQAIRPETKADELFKVNSKQAEEMRKLGFGTVLAIHRDGIARGTAALVTLADKRENEVLVVDKAAAALSFDKGSSQQDYPNSLMGTIALLRQTYLDAQWSVMNPGKEQNISLKAFTDINRLPQIFEVENKLNLIRADKVGDEFKKQYILKGGGDEYQMIKEVKATNAPLIVSLNFPDAYNVEDPMDARRISLEDMKDWEMAPANAGILQKEGITFAITASDLKDKKDFLPNLRKAIQYGLSEEEALKALTATPAKLLNADKLVGSLNKGMLANFIITTDNLFADSNIILENWVQGSQYKIAEIPSDYRGVYTLKIGNQPAKTLQISGTPEKPELKVVGQDTVTGKVSFSGSLVTLSFKENKKSNATIRLSGWLADKNLQGEGQLADATPVKWSAAYSQALTDKAKKDAEKAEARAAQTGGMIYPFRAFGSATAPKQETILIKNATVWTNEKDGKMENADVLLKNGKIAKVGKNLSESGAKVIDGTGKHVTPGIIDEHSHIALNGVNEATQSVTAEVRMSDVVDHEDINIYRQLAGGVTTSQLLHGSANPIGGQSAIIKLRWGKSPDELMVENADSYIKFALGENVKQSNRANATIRFPQSRMGVEQVYVDAFTRAKEYDQAWKNYNKLSKKQKAGTPAPRRDLELETLAEILNGKRFITCHSYVQSEINMMMKVADQMGFKVNTFTHILEGYKVADKMREHGAGASTFGDWWAYKMEVKDAIPYNAGIMNSLGIVTAINSDDAEMARRLNQEAAKSVKYAGMSEEEALKMVTLNPAKLLHLDNRMGSIKVGKDADVVLWNDNPLSIYAKPLKTFVDGIAYYDLEQDEKMRDEMEKERVRLVQLMLNAKAGGARTQTPTTRRTSVQHCEEVEHSEESEFYAY